MAEVSGGLGVKHGSWGVVHLEIIKVDAILPSQLFSPRGGSSWEACGDPAAFAFVVLRILLNLTNNYNHSL